MLMRYACCWYKIALHSVIVYVYITNAVNRDFGGCHYDYIQSEVIETGSQS